MVGRSHVFRDVGAFRLAGSAVRVSDLVDLFFWLVMDNPTGIGRNDRCGVFGIFQPLSAGVGWWNDPSPLYFAFEADT